MSHLPTHLAPIKGYFDNDGLISQWPTKRKKKVMVLEYLATKFEYDRRYTEPEVNTILIANLSYNDHVLIRRELFGNKFMDRTLDGTKYWRLKKEIPVQ